MVGIVDTDILHLEFMGTHLMFLSNSDVGKDLAEQRSDIYVDKVRNRRKIIFATLMLVRSQPRFPMVKELYEFLSFRRCGDEISTYFRMGCSWSFSLMSYGSTWRVHRKLFHRFFNISAADQFNDKIDDAVNAFLRRLSESPERFLKHAHLCVNPCRTLPGSSSLLFPLNAR